MPRKEAGPRWTPEQRQVIELRDRELLVSAAAGSGKTATLVQRIIERITDPKRPTDIDRLLVVTFTRAAASEMRERIGAALEEKLLERPGNDHLQRQALLLHSARITTIDSFCLSVIQNYFHDIDLDPVFRVADEEELTLLRREAVQEILEEEYGQENEDFLSFAACYGGKHQDARLEEYILRLARFAESCPWPEPWLEDMAEQLAEGSMADSAWLRRLEELVRLCVSECLELTRTAAGLCSRELQGPYVYLDALEADREFLEELAACASYREMLDVFDRLEFKALSRKSMPDCPPENKERVKALREQVKECLKELKGDYFFQCYEEMEGDWRHSAIPARVLIRLTLAFRARLAEKKSEKHLLDFSDVEHFALDILAERVPQEERRSDGAGQIKAEENGETMSLGGIPGSFCAKARPAALELRRQYDEIMIDEYQDSNEVQETILRSISRAEEGRPNIFMVGDVKQSIYRFRMAKPELFLQKYNTYLKEDGLFQRIDLHRNFRSRAEVLESVNDLFYKIMGERLGQIEYDKEAALYAGAEYAARDNEAMDNQTELLLLYAEENRAQEEEEEDQSLTGGQEAAAEYTEKEREALLAARKIRELVAGGFTVQKKAAGGGNALAPCEYRDIVILLRTMSGWSEVFAQVLAAQGIPVVSDTQKGYFDTLEIKWLLNYLRCLDNPLQDIPFSGVLLSPFAGLGTNELALLRSGCKNRPLYESVLFYELQGEQEALREKLRLFLSVFRELRARSRILTVPELLTELYDRTGYDSFIAAMPAGAQRSDNLRMFSAKAAAFEQSSYRGLFQFVRYVEKLISYEIDYGEAAGASENDNAVRIMSIHRSKGLEFPVVFVSGTGKKFNFTDMRERVICHPELGLALDDIDEEKRTVVPTLKKKLLQNTLTEETLGEELRLLYVAMTRAREKLFLTGYVKNIGKQRERWEAGRTPEKEKLRYLSLRRSACYLDFIGPALGETETIRVAETGAEQLHRQEQERGEERSVTRREFLDAAPDQVGAREDLWQELCGYLKFDYPYEAERQLPIKTSVSELKSRADTEEEYVVPKLVSLPEEPGPDLWEEADREEKNARNSESGSILQAEEAEGGQGGGSGADAQARPGKSELESESGADVLTGAEKNVQNTAMEGSAGGFSPEHYEGTLPEFLKSEGTMRGTDRGTLYHRILEYLPLKENMGAAEIRKELEQMTEKKLLNPQETEAISVYRLERFYRSRIAARMRAAWERGMLWREQPFVLAIPAGELYNMKSDEPILIQGIIDVFFEEDGELVVLDYKTDYLPEAPEETLLGRYTKQIELYCRALTEITGKQVREAVLYSFYLQKEVPVPLPGHV